MAWTDKSRGSVVVTSTSIVEKQQVLLMSTQLTLRLELDAVLGRVDMF